MASFTASSITAFLYSPASIPRKARCSAFGSLVHSCSQSTLCANVTRAAHPRSPVMSGWIIAPIFRTFSRTGAEIPEDCTAITSAIGATPVSSVSTETFRSRELSNMAKSSGPRPYTGRPRASVTVAGTNTRRERTPKRESCATSGSVSESARISFGTEVRTTLVKLPVHATGQIVRRLLVSAVRRPLAHARGSQLQPGLDHSLRLTVPACNLPKYARRDGCACEPRASASDVPSLRWAVGFFTTCSRARLALLRKAKLREEVLELGIPAQ